jgi:multiple sugar transport system ATP-binding protein
MKLSLQVLSKRFASAQGRVTAVEKITLTVNDGEFLVLLGPSGCGKSTLLSLVAGLEKPTAGSIHFDNRVVASAQEGIFLTPRQRNVAMVFQSYALYPHMIVFENIAFPLRVTKTATSDLERKVRETARLLNIENLLDRKPGELSGGQRQRVAMARALVRRPSVFLLDEPLSNLDAQLRTSTRAQLKRLQEDLGVTTLYVTHDQTEAMTLGHRVAVLRDGRLVQIGRPEDLYTWPATTFVATFIGAPPMNLLEGRLDGQKLIVAGTHMDLRAALETRVSGQVQVGIRPESLELSRKHEEKPNAPVLCGIVTTVEPLGREVLYHIDVQGTDVLALHPEHRFSVGDEVLARFGAGSVHLFDSEGHSIRARR